MYERDIQPLLAQFCYDCHGGGESKGKLALDGYGSFDALLKDHAAWEKVRLQLTSHVMPPARKPQPSAAQRERLLRWIDEAVFWVDPRRPDPGHTVLRRLNRAEYDNTVRDVLRVSVRPGEQFPADDSGYGFDTIGDVLTVSPTLMEKYLRAARIVADEAVSFQRPGRAGARRRAEELITFAGNAEGPQGIRLIADAQTHVGATAVVAHDGVYRVTMQVAATLAGDGPTVARVLIDGKPARDVPVPTEWNGKRGGTKPVVLLMPVPRGEHTISLALANPLEADGVKRQLALERFSFDGPYSPAAPLPSAFIEWLGPNADWATPILPLSGEDLTEGEGRSSLDTGASYFATNGFRRTPLVITAAGKYRFRVKAGAQRAGDEPARFEVKLGAKSLGAFAVTARDQAPEWIEFEADVEAGEHDMQVWFINAFRDEKTGAERWLWVHELTIEGPLLPDRGPARDELPKLLARAGRMIWRRPLSEAERAKLATLVDEALAAGESPVGALRLGIEAMLASPRFLFRNAKAGGPAVDGSVPVDEFTLASRLSYFLWSSAPDERLLDLAERGELRKSLDAEVRRMLADPRAASLTERFAGQWLQLRDVGLVAPDPALFPEFSPQLAADMRRESEMLFSHILSANRPVIELLSADYTFANDRLAKWYGLAGIERDEFRQVSLRDTPRRGILTHGSILTLTSHPTRTSPVKRGKFVLEKVLGTPPPPAPEDVPPLEEKGDLERLPMRKRFEAHRANAACASCHSFLDPPGFAFEHYDAVGRWRDKDEGQPVDDAGRMVDGRSFKDAAELNGILLDRRDEFVRCMTEALLTYALGRGINYTDKLAVRQIVKETAAAEYRFQEMILAVCRSVPFQRMRETAGDSP